MRGNKTNMVIKGAIVSRFPKNTVMIAKIVDKKRARRGSPDQRAEKIVKNGTRRSAAIAWRIRGALIEIRTKKKKTFTRIGNAFSDFQHAQ